MNIRRFFATFGALDFLFVGSWSCVRKAVPYSLRRVAFFGAAAIVSPGLLACVLQAARESGLKARQRVFSRRPGVT